MKQKIKHILWKLLPWVIIIPGFSAAMLCKLSPGWTVVFALSLGALIAITESYIEFKNKQ